MKKEITNDLIEGQPTRAVQLPDGRWVTEKLAHQIDVNFMAEVKQYYSDNFDLINGDNPTLSIVTHIARHFFKLGMSVK